LDQIAELGVEVEGAGLPIAKELVLEGALNGACGGSTVDHHLGKVGGDRAGNPGLDKAVHACPVREVGRGEVDEDVVLQQVLADDEEDLITPPGVVPGVDVEEDVDEAPDVLHADGLSVQIDEGGGFMGQNSVMKGAPVVVDGGGVLLSFSWRSASGSPWAAMARSLAALARASRALWAVASHSNAVAAASFSATSALARAASRLA